MTKPIPPKDIKQFFANADHNDARSIISDVSLREFIAASLNYTNSPWIQFLMRIRGWVARILRLQHPALYTDETSNSIPFEVGASVGILKVIACRENDYWIIELRDSHLVFKIAYVRTTIEGNRSRFDMWTIVHFQNKIGRIYFPFILPFHYVIVYMMVKKGAKGIF